MLKWRAEERQRCESVILKAKAKASQRPDMLRRVKKMREVVADLKAKRAQRKALMGLTGQSGRLQTGDKSERLGRQERFQAELVLGLCVRSRAQAKTQGKGDEAESTVLERLMPAELRAGKRALARRQREEARRLKRQSENVELAKRAQRVVRSSLGLKAQKLKTFVGDYMHLRKELDELVKKSQLEVEEGKGPPSFEELLRPEEAQLHRKGQKPYGWQVPSDDGELITTSESEGEEKAERIKKEVERRRNEDPKAYLFSDAQLAKAVDDGEEEVDERQLSDEERRALMAKRLKEEKAKLAKMRKKCRMRKKQILQKVKRASQDEGKKTKKRPAEKDWGQRDNCVCGPECELPKDWAERMMRELGKLGPYRGDVAECMGAVMELENCPGCWRDLGLPCVLEDECEDVVKLMLAVRSHSSVVERLLEEHVYPLKKSIRTLMTLERLMEQGTLEDLEKMMKDTKVLNVESINGPSMDGVDLEERYGHLLKEFRAVEADHPVNPCYWCDRELSKRRMEIVSLKSLDDKSEKRMSDKTKEKLKTRIKERLKSEGSGRKWEEVFPMGICKQCYTCIGTETVGRQMVENGLGVDEIPIELDVLNQYELMLVSLVKAFYSCVRLKPLKGNVPVNMQLKATRGNVAHLRIPLEETLDHVMKTVEPVACNPGEFLTIFVDVPTKAKVVWRNVVNIEKVIAGLEWLVRNNVLYKDVKIDKEQLRKKLKVDEFVKLAGLDRPETVDGNLEASDDEDAEAANVARGEPFLTQDTDHRLEAEFSMMPMYKAKPAVGKDIEIYTKEPETYKQKMVKGDPLRAQRERELDLMCFPKLHPKGRYGLMEKLRSENGGPRELPIRPAEYYKYRLQNRDPRWRREISYLHVAHFFKLERQIESGVYASMQMGKASAKLSKEELLKKLKGQGDAEDLTADLNVAFAAQKGTQQYWSREQASLNAMDEELGPATWFVTLSCAENEWGELRKLLLLKNSDLKGVKKMNTNELCALDPVSVSEFFTRRMKGFLDKVLLGRADGPLGYVDHYYWRLEYQARGAPHVHMKLWAKDAPILGEEGVTEQMVLEYIEKHLTCAIPTEVENKALHDMVKQFQVHRCTKSCQRLRRGKGKKLTTYCRYGFPRAVTPTAVLNGLAETVRESAKGRGVKKLYALRRTEEERFVNDYNPVVLLGWGANVDVQFVGENKMILNKYITGYITKGEKCQTKGIWEDIGNAKTLHGRLKKLLFACNKNREVGTYEIADELLGNPLHGSSDRVVWLGVGMKDKRIRALKKYKELANSLDDERFQDNLIDTYYPKRHKDLENASLYEIAGNWNTEKVKDPKKERQDEKDWQNYLKTLSGAELEKAKVRREHQKGGKKITQDFKVWMKKKDKRVLLRTMYVPATMQRSEEFFQMLLQLHVPYRNEDELLRGKATFKEAFDEWVELVPVLKERWAHKERLAKAEELKRQLENEGAQEAEAEDAAVEGEWPCEEPEVAAQPKDGFRARTDYMTPEGLAKRVASLNQKQREVYDKVIRVVKHHVGHEACGVPCTEAPEQILEFVSGGAGTGKSRLIEVLSEGVEMESGRGVLIAAPTGLAAVNVSGVTLHKAFHLPVQKDGNFKYMELSHEQDKVMARQMYRTKLIIIDEISMVSNVTLMFIHQRLMGMMGKSDGSRFAGFNVLVLGDLLQLPPVDKKRVGRVFDRISGENWRQAFGGAVVNPFPKGLWREFSYTELTENMRQKGDRKFADMLNDIRVGKLDGVTEELMKRVLKSPTGKTGIEAELELFRKLKAEGKTPVCLVPLREKAAEINLAMLAEEKIRVKFLHAVDTQTVRQIRGKPKGGQSVNADRRKGLKGLVQYMEKHGSVDRKQTGGLADVLPLGPGTRVMLTANLSPEEGLYNGAMGSVSGFLLSTKKQHYVVGVKVKFDSEAGKDEPVERSGTTFQKGKGVMVTRYQFPLDLGYAMTVHKSQGLSLDCVVADLGKDVFDPGQSYVAMSRARTLDGLYLLDFDPKEVRYDVDCVREYNRLRAAYTDLGPMEAGVMLPKSPKKPRKMRKSLEDMMGGLSPTKPPRAKKSKAVEDEVDDVTEEEMIQAMEKVEAEAKSAAVGEKSVPEEDDGITIERLPMEEEEEEGEEPEGLAPGGANLVNFVPLMNTHPRGSGVENICFVNSVVQVMLRSSAVREWVTGSDDQLERAGGFVVKSQLRRLVQAAQAEDGSRRNTRAIRDAVAEYACLRDESGEVIAGNFADYGQHCAIEFMDKMVELCGESLGKLFRFQRSEVAQCGKRGCGAEPVERPTTTDTVWRLYLGKRRGKVTLETLVAEDLSDSVMVRCPKCCDQAEYVVNGKGERVPNEGVKHTVRKGVSVGAEQRMLMLMVNPYVWRGGRSVKSSRKLSGLEAENVELAGKSWRVAAALEHQGPTQNSGHYVAYARFPNGWIRMSDEDCMEMEELPVENLYGILLELKE
jgi:hypothetical protein